MDSPYCGTQGDSAVRDIQSLPDNGHLYAAHVINDIWKETHGEAIVVTDVVNIKCGGAVLHHNRPRTLITSGGLGTMDLHFRRDRREVCEADSEYGS